MNNNNRESLNRLPGKERGQAVTGQQIADYLNYRVLRTRDDDSQSVSENGPGFRPKTEAELQSRSTRQEMINFMGLLKTTVAWHSQRHIDQAIGDVDSMSNGLRMALTHPNIKFYKAEKAIEACVMSPVLSGEDRLVTDDEFGAFIHTVYGLFGVKAE